MTREDKILIEDLNDKLQVIRRIVNRQMREHGEVQKYAIIGQDKEAMNSILASLESTPKEVENFQIMLDAYARGTLIVDDAGRAYLDKVKIYVTTAYELLESNDRLLGLFRKKYNQIHDAQFEASNDDCHAEMLEQYKNELEQAVNPMVDVYDRYVTEYQMILEYLNDEAKASTQYVCDALSVIGEFIKDSLEFIISMKEYEPDPRLQFLKSSVEMIPGIEEQLKNVREYLDKLKEILLEYSNIDIDGMLNEDEVETTTTDTSYTSYNQKTTEDKFYLNFASFLFSEEEKNKNEIRYRYFLIKDGTSHCEHIFQNCTQNDILGKIVDGRMSDENLSNHSVIWHDDNVNIPIEMKNQLKYASDMDDMKIMLMRVCKGIADLIINEEKRWQYEVTNDRFLGLFEYAGTTAQTFFRKIAMEDYGIDFGNDVIVHFARQIIFPAPESSNPNQVASSRQELFTVSIPKIDKVLGNNYRIEITCYDLEKLKEILDDEDIRLAVKAYRLQVSDCPQYLRLLFFNEDEETAYSYSLSAIEYLLIKNDKKLLEENDSIDIDIADEYLMFLFAPEALKNIYLDYDVDEHVKKLAPQYYGEPDDATQTFNINGLTGHIRDFGGGVSGIGFKLPGD